MEQPPLDQPPDTLPPLPKSRTAIVRPPPTESALTLRDRLASAALQAIASHFFSPTGTLHAVRAADEAYRLADAMLNARNRIPEPEEAPPA